MRMTRSTTRIFEDAEQQQQCTAADVAPSEQQQRAPLGDITGTAQNEMEIIAVVEDDEKKATNGPSPRKTPRRSRPPRLDFAADENVEVLEDDYQSETSSAAEEACRELLRDATGSEIINRPRTSRSDKISTPPSKAVKRARKQLKPDALTPRLKLDTNASPRLLRSSTRIQASDSRRNSSGQNVGSKTPAGSSRFADRTIPGKEGGEEEVHEVSETIADTDTPTGSPAAMEASWKRRSRIEDSFDALDAMEDMLDEVRDSLACVDRPHTADSTSPEHIRQVQLQKAQEMLSKSLPQTPRGRSIETAIKAKTQERMSTRIMNDMPRRTASTRSSSKPVSTVSANSRSTKTSRTDDRSVRSVRPATKPVEMPSKPRPAVSSVVKKPFVPVKSTKQPTTSSFTLPGEAISARIKAQREARQANGSTTISGAPVLASASSAGEKRKSMGPEVRMTATALARLQIAKGEKPTPITRTRPVARPSVATGQSQVPASRATASTASTAARSAAARPAAITTSTGRTTTLATKPPAAGGSLSAAKPLANTPAKRPRPISGVFGDKVESGLKRMASTRSISGQPAAKKPATETTKMSLADRQEAAKRARAEAAERGRLASREWAERMKKRSSAALTAPKPSAVPTE